ncbi:MAG: Na+/H+ antiporter NhaA [Candidatus Liberibacter europaeus]|uniref:Na(+)/H(+) antiporter NhaA n=1 Tax=Candidatus Liberibacter europaeus TaxID=744859 RepID=A0A2T4VYI8_9HYPH|nr:Na+/H+ antiporter NhaA [Candidatus Liberibacter europaeus]PTL86835.1 MAG: Na+/H+ antiporter NhaA [Candidatus Liberibacter europaeus]
MYIHNLTNWLLTRIQTILKKDSFLGILLIIVAIITMIASNISFSSSYYFDFLELKIIHLTTKEWINDILMASYFFMIGIEINHELTKGELSSWKKRFLPSLGALGGIIFPALIYLFINRNTEIYIKGWAIPTATDIAFTLGILSLIGPNFPSFLKIFFTALTIIDDLSAIAIIAIFYTQDINLSAMGIATFIIILLVLFNRSGITNLLIYGILGSFLWYFIFKSGIHTTVFGFIFAMLIPHQKVYSINKKKYSFYLLGNKLKHWVNLLILPAFVFVNSGFSLYTISYKDLFDPIVWGVMMGLFIGKQLGIFLFSFVAIKIGWGILPKKSNWHLLYGGSVLCGIGFTMSLFLTLQAFPNDNNLQEKAKLGIISASVMSGILAYIILKPARYRKNTPKHKIDNLQIT